MTKEDLTFNEFSKLVRDSLNKIYDSAELSQHPLIEVFSSDSTPTLQRTRQLRQILIESIEALRPNINIPAQSPDWRAYHILEKRYIDGLSTNEIMGELAISRAQLFRDQARLLDMIVEALWQKASQIQLSISSLAIASITQSKLPDINLELLDVKQLLRELQPIIEAISHKNSVSCHYQLSASPVLVTLDRVLFRQIILLLINELLSTAMDAFKISEYSEPQDFGIRLSASNCATSISPVQIEAARNLAAKLNVDIHLEQDNHQIAIYLVWIAISEHHRLLVVDDNADIADLFRRYLVGYAWIVVAANSVASALGYLEQMPVTALILDVMMPDSDGWDLLLQLKSKPHTAKIPIFVCSAVDNKATAIALGADGYIAKPVTQVALLENLKPLLRI